MGQQTSRWVCPCVLSCMLEPSPAGAQLTSLLSTLTQSDLVHEPMAWCPAAQRKGTACCLLFLQPQFLLCKKGDSRRGVQGTTVL